MFRKIIGYIFVFTGFLCFLLIGGGSMRYRNRSVNPSYSIYEDIIAIFVILLIPVIGFFLLKIGFKILEGKNKN